MPTGSAVPIEALATLRRRLAALPARHPDRKQLMDSTAQLYAISRATLYRLLRGNRRPKDAAPADRGVTRVIPAEHFARICSPSHWAALLATSPLALANRPTRSTGSTGWPAR